MNFQLKWIFFDFGSTIADESKAEEIYFKDILEVFSKHGIHKHFEEIFERSKGLIANRNVKTHRELFSLSSSCWSRGDVSVMLDQWCPQHCLMRWSWKTVRS